MNCLLNINSIQIIARIFRSSPYPDDCPFISSDPHPQTDFLCSNNLQAQGLTSEHTEGLLNLPELKYKQ